MTNATIADPKSEFINLKLTIGQIINGWQFVEMDLRGKDPYLGFVRNNERITITPYQIGAGWCVSLYETAHGKPRYALADWSAGTLSEAMAELEVR